MKRNAKRNKGITLIALVITIIVLLILSGVAIASLSGSNGIITRTSEAKEMNKKGEVIDSARVDIAEKQLLKEDSNITEEEFKQVLLKYGTLSTGAANINEETLTTKENYNIPVKDIYEVRVTPPISTTEPYVGKYADIDDNGTIDGIIFADLAIGNTVPGNCWDDVDGAYTIPIEIGLKEYYVKERKIDERWDINTAKEVIVPIKGTVGKDRFYIMALEDVDTYNSWYFNATKNMSDWETRTSVEFGKGKDNTNAMIELGQNNGIDNTVIPNVDYGELRVYDLWNLESVKNTTTNKWFVPSRAEWAAFCNELEIDKNYGEVDYYKTHNLADWYWSSSQYDEEWAWRQDMDFGSISGFGVNMDDDDYEWATRLAATF